MEEERLNCVVRELFRIACSRDGSCCLLDRGNVFRNLLLL